MKTSPSRSRAFTLAELLVAMTVAVLVFGTLGASGLTFYRRLVEFTETAQRVDDQNRVFDYLLRDVRSASGAKIENVVTDASTGISRAYRLVLQVPAAYEKGGALPSSVTVSSSGTAVSTTYSGGTMLVTYDTVSGYFTRTTSTNTGTTDPTVTTGTQKLMALPIDSTVTFSPITLSGAVGTITVRLTFRQNSQRAASLVTSTRSLTPLGPTTILP